MRGCSVVVVALLGALAQSSVCGAQELATQASRRLLLENAEQLRAAGEHAAALEAAQRAEALQRTPSVEAFVAEELLTMGRMVDAFAEAEECVLHAEGDRRLADREALLARCRSIATTARSRVAFVVLRPTGPALPGQQLLVGGRVVPPALYGEPYTVNPGVVEVTLQAPGARPARQRVVLQATETASLALPALVLERVVVAAPVRIMRAPRPLSPGPFVFLGAGALGLAAGGLFFGLRGAALANCPANYALQQYECATQAARDQAQGAALTWNAATNAALITGAALALGGAVWLVAELVSARRAGAHARREGRVRPALALAPGLAAGSVAVAF